MTRADHTAQTSSTRSSTARPVLWILALTMLVGLGIGMDLSAQEISSEALEQVALLMEEKRNRTAAQQKIDSGLLLELRTRRGDALLERLPHLSVARRADAEGMVLVDLQAVVDDSLKLRLEELGGKVHSAFARWGAIRATLPIEQLEELASDPAVRGIRSADLYMTQMNTTEGDVAHGADVARTNFSVDGTGVSVGVISDSVDALATVQASGDLPATVTVLPGQSGNPGTSEGTALMEIVHDMAPGADLFFATALGGQAQFAQNILDLQSAGCSVIVDDVLYLAEPVFQDGIVAQAVDEVAALGVTFFSAAGNSGNLEAGTSGVWEGLYSGIALPTPLNGAGLSAHDFGSGANSNELTFDPPVLATLQWSDPFGGSNNDYDLYLLDDTLTNVLAASTNTQNGTQDPIEFVLSGGDDLGNRLVVVKFNGDDRFIHLNTHRGQLDIGTDGQIFGHPAAEGALAVGAVDVATAGGGLFVGGGANPPEPFTSDGPRRIFFEVDGTPVGALSNLGGQPSNVRQKPDLAAADGVSTATPGFNPFFGSSASAPHAAGIAALLKEIMSSLSSDGAKDRFTKDALDIGQTGVDPVSGSGIPNANQTLDGKKGFQGDNFSVKPKLGKNDGTGCSDQHLSGFNGTKFDGNTNTAGSVNGNDVTVKATQSDPDLESEELTVNATGPDSDSFLVDRIFGADDDLFPEGFEDPDTGTPLDAACIEVGIDDKLEADCPQNVTSATLQFFDSNGSGIFPNPIDVTSVFNTDPWDGRFDISVPNMAGQNIGRAELKILMQESNAQPIFSDGFESGNTSAWTTN